MRFETLRGFNKTLCSCCSS